MGALLNLRRLIRSRVITFNISNTVADPAFPRRRGVATPEVGEPAYHLAIFFLKTA